MIKKIPTEDQKAWLEKNIGLLSQDQIEYLTTVPLHPPFEHGHRVKIGRIYNKLRQDAEIVRKATASPAPQKIERTAGITTYAPRIEPEPPLPQPADPKFEQPQVDNLPVPPLSTPDLSRSGGQFSLRRLVIQNHYTRKTRRMSVPFHKNPLDFLDRSCEVIVENQEVKYWSEQQRDGELKAFKTLSDPLALNSSPYAQRPPQDISDSLVNAE